MKVLVTGASGFVGSHLVPALVAGGQQVLATSRRPCRVAGAEWRPSPELNAAADWSTTLRDIDTVVHLAGRAHITGPSADEELHCRRINAEGTRQIARCAVEAGVRHFIYMSSCHAVAASCTTMIDRETAARPVSAYGRSKFAAEQAVREEMTGSGCGWTILRPPAVYGRGHRGNLARLARAVRSGLPLPVKSLRNRRSFLGVENLADFIVRGCLGNTASTGKIFYPADNEDFSTPQLIGLLAEAEGCRARMFALPQGMLAVLALSPGLGTLRTLFSSLFVDKEPARQELGWFAPYSTRSLLAAAYSLRA